MNWASMAVHSPRQHASTVVWSTTSPTELGRRSTVCRRTSSKPMSASRRVCNGIRRWGGIRRSRGCGTLPSRNSGSRHGRVHRRVDCGRRVHVDAFALPRLAAAVTCMWGVTVYCQTCGRGKVVAMPVQDPERWPDCDICGPTGWFTADQPDDLKFPYLLNHNDKAFLKSIRIEAE